MHHAANGDDGHVVAFDHHIGFAKRYLIRPMWHMIRNLVVHYLVLEEDHRIIVTHGSDHKTLCVIGRRGDHAFEPWNMREQGVERLRMLSAGAETSTDLRSNDERR